METAEQCGYGMLDIWIPFLNRAVVQGDKWGGGVMAWDIIFLGGYWVGGDCLIEDSRVGYLASFFFPLEGCLPIMPCGSQNVRWRWVGKRPTRRLSLW